MIGSFRGEKGGQKETLMYTRPVWRVWLLALHPMENPFVEATPILPPSTHKSCRKGKNLLLSSFHMILFLYNELIFSTEKSTFPLSLSNPAQSFKKLWHCFTDSLNSSQQAERSPVRIINRYNMLLCYYSRHLVMFIRIWTEWS